MLASTIVVLAIAQPTPAYITKVSPCPQTDGRFGESAVILDYNGDTTPDLAVGESGTDAVYVFFGPLLASWIAITPTGALAPGVCPPAGGGARFGQSLAAAPLDGTAGDELLVGATAGNGEVRIFGRGLIAPVVITSAQPQLDSDFGYRLAVADLDGDLTLDLAVGAPRFLTGACAIAVGRVHVFYGDLLGGSVTEGIVSNPQFPSPDSCNGYFGVDVAAADGDNDGRTDLYVSAEGNPFAGIQNGGSVDFYSHPVLAGATPTITVGDTKPDLCNTATRYGKSIDARGQTLLVGAPIKSSIGDSCATTFVGGAFAYFGPSLAGRVLNDAPQPPTSRLGFRVALVDKIGDATPDFVAKSMGTHELYVWDGASPLAPPVIFPGPASNSIHWWMGTARGSLVSGGKEELVIGDPEDSGNTGKVTIWR